jgi:hypothetical protein
MLAFDEIDFLSAILSPLQHTVQDKLQELQRITFLMLRLV